MGVNQNTSRTNTHTKMSLSNFDGEWEQTEKGANFKEFLAAIGIGLIKRNVANNMGRTLTFNHCTSDDTKFHIVSKSKLKTNDVYVTLGEKKEGKRDDDMEVVTVFFWLMVKLFRMRRLR